MFLIENKVAIAHISPPPLCSSYNCALEIHHHSQLLVVLPDGHAALIEGEQQGPEFIRNRTNTAEEHTAVYHTVHTMSGHEAQRPGLTTRPAGPPRVRRWS